MPTLNLPTFKKQVAERRLSPVYLFVGEDVKLADRLVDDVESTIDPADRAFGIERLYAGEASGAPVEIVAAARTLPMLGDRRVVIVLRAERLLKPKRTSKASLDTEEAESDGSGSEEPLDSAALEDYLAVPVPSTTLVFVATDVDRARRLTKKLVEKAQVVECGGLAADGPGARREARATASEWLQDELRRSGRTIDTRAAGLLADRSGNDITKLRGDIERLLLFAGERKAITSEDVLEVTAVEERVDDEWGVTNAIASGNHALALAEIGRRLDRGDSPHQLLGQLRWWVANRLVEGDPHRIKPAMEALLRTDLALKSSGGEDRVLMERLVVELTGRPVGRPQTGWR